MAVTGERDGSKVTIGFLPSLAIIGALLTNAPLSETRPKRALVLLARGREENRAGRGKATMIYTHVLNRGGRGVHSPADRLGLEVASPSGQPE